jgi:DNA transformation protein and related proteins
MSKKKHPPIVDKLMAYLLPHGPITVKAMFGGYGIFYDKVIFASIIDHELYFRIDEESREDFESKGSKQFIYEGMKKPVGMPYFTLPDAILKNPKELKKWIDRAYLISLTSKKTVKKSRIKH